MTAKTKIAATEKSRDCQPIEAKALVASAWAPQPNPLTREELRKIVMEQIG